ncbi:hypothetical protein A2W24_00800 [Microgenomates group bacterium RBG_16_45_19]|nr:MAG: hypothetical protein A2W24_00800 [Microgenomates group bacterium RBG_16_45_19]
MNHNQVELIITDYHDSKHLSACLKSLAQADEATGVRVNLVRIGCQKKVIVPPNLKCQADALNDNQNRGYAGSVNTVLRRLASFKSRVIIVMNDDVEVSPGWLAPLWRQLDQPKVGLVSPKIYFYPGREYHHQEYQEAERGKVIWYGGGIIDWENIYAWHWGVNEVDHGQWTKTQETDFATGCCVAFRSDLINKIGFWDERYFLYLEDTDWSVRAKRAGFTILMTPQSEIWHKNAGSTGGPGSRWHRYYLSRNRLLFASKFGTVKTRAAVWRQALTTLRQGQNIEKRAVRDAFYRRWGQAKI